jgi:hypothetical protein
MAVSQAGDSTDVVRQRRNWLFSTARMLGLKEQSW